MSIQIRGSGEAFLLRCERQQLPLLSVIKVERKHSRSMLLSKLLPRDPLKINSIAVTPFCRLLWIDRAQSPQTLVGLPSNLGPQNIVQSHCLLPYIIHRPQIPQQSAISIIETTNSLIITLQQQQSYSPTPKIVQYPSLTPPNTSSARPYSLVQVVKPD